MRGEGDTLISYSEKDVIAGTTIYTSFISSMLIIIMGSIQPIPAFLWDTLHNLVIWPSRRHNLQHIWLDIPQTKCYKKVYDQSSIKASGSSYSTDVDSEYHMDARLGFIANTNQFDSNSPRHCLGSFEYTVPMLENYLPSKLRISSYNYSDSNHRVLWNSMLLPWLVH